MNKRSQSELGEEQEQNKVYGDNAKKTDAALEFARLLADCVQAQENDQGDKEELTEQDLNTISAYGAKRLEEMHEKLTAEYEETVVIPDDPESKEKVLNKLDKRKVQGRVVIIEDVPEHVARIEECPERLPEFLKVLEEFDDETFRLLLEEEPRWLLAEKKERTNQRKCLGEFETFSKTLLNRRIATVQECDKILFGANKTHARLKEDFVFKPAGAIAPYRIFFYYIDECMFSCLVINTSNALYMGCFFIQSHKSLQADLAVMMKV